MAIVQKRSKRKATGGRYSPIAKKEVNLGNEPTFTLVGVMKQKEKRVRGGALKTILLMAQKANVFNPKSKKYAIAEIKSVLENAANRNFVRRNIVTKGAVINTSLGKARVTSRPGQGNVVNAILLD